MEGALHDAEPMDVEKLTMEESMQGKFDTVLVKIVKDLKEVRPIFKRELLASRRRNSI